MYLCTDLNPHATHCTRLTSLANSILLDPILTDLTESLLPRLHRAVDVLVFNPPYVETTSSEVDVAQSGGNLDRAWAGGEHGMVVTERVLAMVDVR